MRTSVSTLKIKRVIKGSIVWLKRECGKAGCHCIQGEKHESMYISRSVQGKTTMTYIPHRYEGEVSAAVAEYKRVLQQLEALSAQTMKGIKKGRRK